MCLFVHIAYIETNTEIKFCNLFPLNMSLALKSAVVDITALNILWMCHV